MIERSESPSRLCVVTNCRMLKLVRVAINIMFVLLILVSISISRPTVELSNTHVDENSLQSERGIRSHVVMLPPAGNQVNLQLQSRNAEV